MLWISIFSGTTRSSLEILNTSISLSFIVIGDLVILKSLVDVLLAAAVGILFLGVWYGLVVGVAFFGGVSIVVSFRGVSIVVSFGEVSIVVFFGGILIVVSFGGVSIVLEVNFMRKYMWCGVCVREEREINKRKNKKQKTETENQS